MENKFEFQNIVEVKNIHIDRIVNSYLSEGWVLLGVAPYKDPETSDIIYSIGRPKES